MATARKSAQTELQAYIIPNLIQGVSQQAAQERRDTQSEAQFDCVNSPVTGCEARPGFDFVSRISGVDLSAAFTYEIFRGDAEHYLVVINNTAYGSGTARKLHVYDLNTGDECTVAFTADETYLAVTGDPKDSFVGTTLEDTTFLGNKEIKPLMSTALVSPAAENAAILFFKAGGYSVTFQVAVVYNGKKYTWSYLTPDNSTVANAAYISTNQLAATFFRSFTGVAVTVDTSGDDVVAGNTGVGGAAAGQTTGMTGAETLVGLGFTCRLNGNCIMISRGDANEFSIDTGDGVGDTYLRCVKDTVQAFSDLPKSCFEGFTTKVIGTNRQTQDDYYVQFVGTDGSSGYWKEIVAPGTPLTFNDTTMPHILFNSDVNTFEFKVAPWGSRVSGDGVLSAKDPSFVGQYIKDLFYDHGRFGIMSEGTCVWARTRNPYVFFPDTAQTVLDTDPIDLSVGGGKTIALLRRMVQVGEGSFLWAEKVQFRANSGVNPFKQDTVEAPLSTSYEFSPVATPKPVGESLYFISEPGEFAAVRDLAVRDGRPLGATDVTEHVPRYVPAGTRWIGASDTLRVVMVDSETTPSYLYVYNYLISASMRAQSAWNTWRLPSGCKVLWLSISLNFCYLLVQRGTDEAVFLKMDLSVNLVDPVTGADYLTRLDMRTTEAACTLAYSATTDETTITLPYKVPDAAGYASTDTDACPMFVANRTSSASFVRGRTWPIQSITATTIVVKGDCTGEDLYIGFRITSSRTPSRFYLKSPRGLIPTEQLLVKDYIVVYDHTGYFRADVLYKGETEAKSYVMTGRVFGDPANVLGAFPISEGQFKVPIDAQNDAYTVTLINDSFLPSRWTSASYNFMASFLAHPSAYGQGSAARG